MNNIFITYQEALTIIEANKIELPKIKLPIKECGGYFLAEDLIADRDFPPFDRVTMDGIAINYSSYAQGQRNFPIKGIAAAGSPLMTLEDSKGCIEVMTGAILPENTDTVIRYEDIVIQDSIAHITIESIVHRQSIHTKGTDAPKDSIIVNAGKRISSAEVNIAAAVGKAEVAVYRMPKAAVISTGDELVDVHETPLLHQIRNSNVYGIHNTLKSWKIPANLNYLPDDKEKMHLIISDLLKENDFLVITGGVSKGKFDFLPDVLDSLGVRKLFHKIKQRPGKPFWFGKSTEGTTVFALPGNPVSSFVCLNVYVRFWLQKSLEQQVESTHVALAEDIHFKPDLTYYLEATLKSTENATLVAHPITGNGSGDFAKLVNADGFLVLPQEKTIFKKGEAYPFISYRVNL